MTERHTGAWSVARSIVDGTTGSVILCAGRATLRPIGGRIRYDEAVSFRLGERTIDATRTYYYRCANGIIDAAFAGGGVFFRATIASDGTASAVHLCGNDVYTGSFALRDSAAWHTRWEVSGAKAMRIDTHYTRD